MKYMLSQIFTVAVTVVLLITFYVLLATDLSAGSRDSLVPMILIIIAIINLTIYATLARLEFHINPPAQRKRR